MKNGKLQLIHSMFLICEFIWYEARIYHFLILFYFIYMNQFPITVFNNIYIYSYSIILASG